METNSPKELNDALKYMKFRVRNNLNKIRDNNENIRYIIATNKPFLREFQEEINQYKLNNKRLSAENDQLVRIQKFIIGYFNSFNIDYEKEENNNKSLSIKEIQQLTIKGEIPLDKNHPLISDQNFLNKMLKHYESSEEYEKCANILKILHDTVRL
jgi:hypothetical protein